MKVYTLIDLDNSNNVLGVFDNLLDLYKNIDYQLSQDGESWKDVETFCEIEDTDIHDNFAYYYSELNNLTDLKDLKKCSLAHYKSVKRNKKIKEVLEDV